MTHPGMDVGPLLGGRVELDFLAGLIAGFSTSVHCLAMCGGIAAAIALRGAGGAVNAGGTAVLARTHIVVQAQAARVLVYTLLGVAAGALGWGLQDVRPAGAFHDAARYLGALVLVAAAFSVFGVAIFGGSGGRLAARLSAPLTRRLHHLHKLGPVGLGAAWGLMPCALVYLTTFYAGLTGSPLQGALVMAGFGLGTVPAMTAIAAGASALPALASSLWLRGLAAAALFALAVFSVW